VGLFRRKPNRAFEAELIKHATHAMNWFGHALQLQETNPQVGTEGQGVDLTVKENRGAIRDDLVRIICAYELSGCSESEIDGSRLMPLAKKQLRSPIEDAALCSALTINSINWITRVYYEEYPTYRPMFEMVDNLAKMCCTGAAQTIGPDLPSEVVETWPYFSRIFEDAKRANTWLWPDV
jgi:hypothetical protein